MSLTNRESRISIILGVFAIRKAGASPEFTELSVSFLHDISAYRACPHLSDRIGRVFDLFLKTVIYLLVDVAVGESTVRAFIRNIVMVSQ